jgi:Short C-terminal domain
MRMGRRGPGLVRMAAGTAVIAGTAGAVRHHQEQKYANQAYEQQAQQAAMDSQQDVAALQAQVAALQAQQSQPAPAAAAAPAAGGSDDMMAQLSKLADLKAAGILSDEEFAAAKAKLLG